MVTVDNKLLNSEVISEQIDQLIDKISQSEQAAKPAIAQPVVLFMGNTGSGKSTLVNYLEGCEMYEALGELGSVVEAKNPIARIGDEFTSETFGVHAYPGANFTYCDCPGFLESRGTLYDIANALSIKYVTEKSRTVLGVVVVLNYNSLISDKGAGLRQTAENLQFLMQGNTDKHINSIILIITRAPAHQNIEMIQSTIRRFNEPLINSLLASTILYDPLDRQPDLRTSRQDILKKISDLTPIDNPASVFQYSLHSTSLLAINGLKNNMLDLVKNSLIDHQFDKAHRMIKLLFKLSQLKLAEQEYQISLNLVQERMNALAEQAKPYIETEQYTQLHEIFTVINQASCLKHNNPALRVKIELIQMLTSKISTIDPRFCCPITHQIIEYPVVASDGYTYSKKNIEQILATTKVSPISKVTLSNRLIDNRDLNQQLLDYLKQKVSACLFFLPYCRTDQLYHQSEIFIQTGLKLAQNLPQSSSYVINFLQEWLLLQADKPTGQQHQPVALIEETIRKLIVLLCLETRYAEAADYYVKCTTHDELISCLTVPQLEALVHALRMQNHLISSVELLHHLAKHYEQDENLPEMERCYQEALALDPDAISSHLGLAAVREYRGDTTGAAQIILEQLLERHLQSPNITEAKELSSKLLKLFDKPHQYLEIQNRHVEDRDFKKIGKTLVDSIRYLYPNSISNPCKIIQYKHSDERGFELQLKLANVEAENILENFANTAQNQLKKSDRVLIYWNQASKSLFATLKTPYTIQDRDKLIYTIKQSIQNHHKYKLYHSLQAIDSLTRQVNALENAQNHTTNQTQEILTNVTAVLRNPNYKAQFLSHQKENHYISKLFIAASPAISKITQAISLEDDLMQACRDGNLEQVKALHQQGAILDAKSIGGDYPLQAACKILAVDVIDYIHQALQEPADSWRVVSCDQQITQSWERLEERTAYFQNFSFTLNTTHGELQSIHNDLYRANPPAFTIKKNSLRYYVEINNLSSRYTEDEYGKTSYRIEFKDSLQYYHYCRTYNSDYRWKGDIDALARFNDSVMREVQQFTSAAIQEFCSRAAHLPRLRQTMKQYTQNLATKP